MQVNSIYSKSIERCNFLVLLDATNYMNEWLTFRKEQNIQHSEYPAQPCWDPPQTLCTDKVLLVLYFSFLLSLSLAEWVLIVWFVLTWVFFFSYPQRAGCWAGGGCAPRWGLSALIRGNGPRSETPLWRSVRPPRGASARRSEGPGSSRTPRAARFPRQRKKRLRSALERDTGTLFDGCLFMCLLIKKWHVMLLSTDSYFNKHSHYFLQFHTNISIYSMDMNVVAILAFQWFIGTVFFSFFGDEWL